MENLSYLYKIVVRQIRRRIRRNRRNRRLVGHIYHYDMDIR